MFDILIYIGIFQFYPYYLRVYINIPSVFGSSFEMKKL